LKVFHRIIKGTSSKIIDDSSLSPRKKAQFQKLNNWLFYTLFYVNEKQIRCCVTAVAKNRLATFAHENHRDLKDGSTVRIFSITDDSCIDVKVIKVDPKKDFILMESDTDVCEVAPTLGVPFQGETYIQLGLSAISQEKSPLSVSRGVVTSVYHNSNGHFLGSAGSNPGESGGGCYSELNNTLYGINVGCERIPIHDNTRLFELGTRHPARAHIVPSSYFI
jgi:hypothetical protein